jgi:hypothetical protein
MKTKRKTPFTMKTIWIKSALLLALVASSGAITLASGGQKRPNAFTSESEITSEKMASDHLNAFYRWIRKHLATPQFLQGNADNRVELVVRIDSEGRTLVDSISGANSELVNYVKTEIEQLSYPAGEPNRTYHFAIRFHQDHANH